MNDSLDPILQQEEQRRLRKQLIWRLSIAVILVAGAFGILSWLDQGKETRSQMTVSTPRHALIASQASATTAVTASATIASTPEATPPAASTPDATPLPTVASAATPQLNSPQEAADQQPAPRKPPFVTTPIKLAHPAKPEPMTASPDIVPSAKADIQIARPTPAAGKPANRTNTSAARYPSPVATPRGYTVQAGVFLHTSNAEKMLMRLQTAGIPAYLESRVQIGPFSSKTEAENAIRKLRQAGIEPVLKVN